MKGVTFDGKGVVSSVDMPEPVPGQGEVVIEGVFSAICGSEMEAYKGDGYSNANGGHEAAGVVVQVGEGVQDIKIGQRVGVSSIAGCGKCSFCARGQYTWCNNIKFYGNTHAEMFLASANACHVLPYDVPWEVGVLMSGDGLGVPYHTSKKVPEGTDTVAVFGLGPIGLGQVLMQSYLGRRVIAIDFSQYRLDYALTLGAKWLINAGVGDALQRIKDITAGYGADVAIEVAGRPETARQCFAAVRKGGTVIFNGEQGEVPLSPSEDFIRRDITAAGSWFYHFSEFGSMLKLYRSGLAVQDLVSHVFPLTDAQEAYAEFAAGRTAKVLLQLKD